VIFSEAIVPALIGGVAALAVQFIGVNATNMSTRQLAVQSCVQRIDEQEAKLREVMERLFSALGGFVGETIVDQSSILPASKQVLKSAFEVNAYAPPELAFSALTVAMVVHQGVIATTGAEQEAAIAAALQRTKLLPQIYRDQLNEFDKLRDGCHDE